MKLGTKADIQARAVRIKLTGHASCHWHTGSGDNRHDHGSRKTYCTKRVSAWGNFYATDLLDGGGEDVKFNPDSGAGDLTINVDDQDLSSLTLAVRPMDYDWGKKDDLLGEALVKVEATLLGDAAGTEVSFPLRRKGKAEKGEVTLKATLETTKRGNKLLKLVCVKATGLRKADWFGKNDVYVQAYVVDPGTDEDAALPEPDKTLTLPGGSELEVPFSLKLPLKNLPSSMNYGWGDSSHVQYSLYSNIDISWKADPSCRRYITVLSSELPSPSLFAPRIRGESEPQTIYVCDPCCFSGGCCAPQGTAQFNAVVDKAYLSPGDNFFVALSGVNSTEMECKMIIRLVMHYVLQGGSQRKHGTQTFPIYSEDLGPNSSVEWSSSAPKCFTTPLCPPQFSGAGRDPIKWHYRLEIVMDMPGMTTTDIVWSQPVFVGAFPVGMLHTMPQYADIMNSTPLKIDAIGEDTEAVNGLEMEFPPLGEDEAFPEEVSAIVVAAVVVKDQQGGARDPHEDEGAEWDKDHPAFQIAYPVPDASALTAPVMAMPIVASVVVVDGASTDNPAGEEGCAPAGAVMIRGTTEVLSE